MAGHLPSSMLYFLLVFSSFTGLASGQNLDDDEWRGNRRAIVIEDRNPFGRTPQVYFTRGLLCGWTPHGLCFSPDDRKDIHDFYVIPFENVGRDVYCDQVPNLSSGWGFGVNSVVLAKFRAASDKSEFWQAYVTTYWISGRGRVLRLKARTAFLQFGVNQIEETFLPNQVWLQGAHDACRFFKTDCLPNEYCVTRKTGGRVWPGEYKCVCRDGWKHVRGRGCVDVDECKKFPCAAYDFCVNTPGSYICQCPTGYKGEKCDIDIDECQMNPCPSNSICKNIPGSFNCTCKSGYSGKGCSESSGFSLSSESDPVLTFKIIEAHSAKEISIPREKPAIVIRKAVHIQDSGYKEMATMGSLMTFLIALGIFLYWKQRKKRTKKSKLKDDSNQASESTETTQSSHMLIDEEKTLSFQVLADEETIADSQLLERNIVPSIHFLENKGDIASFNTTENRETISSRHDLVDGGTSNQSLKKDIALSDCLLGKGYVLRSQSMNKEDVPSSFDKEIFSSPQSLDKKVLPSSQLKDKEVLPSNQSLDKEVLPSSQSLDKEVLSGNQSSDKDVLPSSQSLDKEVTPGNQSLDKEVRPSSHTLEKEVIPFNWSLDKEVLPSSQSLDKEVLPSNQSLDKEVLLSNRSLDKDDLSSSQSTEKEIPNSQTKDQEDRQRNPSLDKVK